MKEFIWKLIAKFVTKPAVRSWLVDRALNRPYKHLGKYMLRYWLIDRKYKPFGIQIINNLFCARIHYINREDVDPVLHDHPGDWRTIILAGWYIEEDSFGNKAMRKVGDTVGKSAFEPHRIDSVSAGGVVTLFIMWRRINRWGFYVGSPPEKSLLQRLSLTKWENRMKNINMSIIDNKLTITIDLTQDFGLSQSQKTNIVGSTEGWSKLPGDKHPEFSIGINCIKKLDKK